MNVWRHTTETTYQQMIDKKEQLLTDEEVLRRFELTAPMTIVRILRLSLFIRIAAGKIWW